MSNKFCLSLIFLLLTNLSYAQEIEIPKDYFRSPLDIPLVLSGTFGELRPNHFHAGIDLKTKGQSGLKIYSVADGYVSRIKVSPTGYGKAIYIKHPNGFTSVYAHIMRYNDKIEAIVKKEQYAKKSFAIEIFPEPNQISVKKGEIIALSGNSGSSFAPHLHFELRDTKTEKPQNGMHFGFNIKDNINPIIKEIKLYQNIVIENVTNDIDENLFYTLFNMIDLDSKFLIVTSIEPIVKINFNLADLNSRSKDFLLQDIERPDDDLIYALLVKNLSDRQISLEKKLLDYIIKRIDRSYGKIFNFIYKIDEISLKKKKSIDLKILKEVLGE